MAISSELEETVVSLNHELFMTKHLNKLTGTPFRIHQLEHLVGTGLL